MKDSQSLAQACINGDGEKVRRLLVESKESPEAVGSCLARMSLNAAGLTPLHLSAASGQTALVTMLLDEFGAEVDGVDSIKETSLLKAAFQGHGSTIQVLLERGANVDYEDEEGFTALHKACQEGHVDTVEVLLEFKAKVNVTSKDGITPLMLSCLGGHVDIAKSLLMAESNPNLLDKSGCCSLYWAIKNRNFHICKIIEKAESASTGTPHHHTNHFESYECVHENEVALNGVFAPSSLLEDTPSWIHVRTGKPLKPHQVEPTDGFGWLNEWGVDLSNPGLDKAGWSYATGFIESEENWKSSPEEVLVSSGAKAIVRRRCWVRFSHLVSKEGILIRDAFNGTPKPFDYIDHSGAVLALGDSSDSLLQDKSRQDALKILLCGALCDENEERKKSAISLAVSMAKPDFRLPEGKDMNDFLQVCGWKWDGDSISPLVTPKIILNHPNPGSNAQRTDSPTSIQSPRPNINWQPDSSSQKCSECKKRFSLFVLRESFLRQLYKPPMEFSEFINDSKSDAGSSSIQARTPQQDLLTPTIFKGLHNWRRDSAPDLASLPQSAATAFSTFANNLATATSTAINQISTSISNLDEQLSRHFDLDEPEHTHGLRRASSASDYVPSSVHVSDLDEGTMTDCPVCGKDLLKFKTEKDKEDHTASGVDLGSVAKLSYLTNSMIFRGQDDDEAILCGQNSTYAVRGDDPSYCVEGMHTHVFEMEPVRGRLEHLHTLLEEDPDYDSAWAAAPGVDMFKLLESVQASDKEVLEELERLGHIERNGTVAG
ncbi:hypothetical protein HDU97_009660 [Phlyctochytrium planicorne]|nr:hypothetical protein HDU97_009660 [Phlyctochytrium planicorne]